MNVVVLAVARQEFRLQLRAHFREMLRQPGERVGIEHAAASSFSSLCNRLYCFHQSRSVILPATRTLAIPTLRMQTFPVTPYVCLVGSPYLRHLPVTRDQLIRIPTPYLQPYCRLRTSHRMRVYEPEHLSRASLKR